MESTTCSIPAQAGIFRLLFLRKQEYPLVPFLRKQESSMWWYRHGFLLALEW